jgi:hypothetical protein
VDGTDEKIRLEALRSAMESAKDAIKACILINGGAAGALLVFMGHLATARDNQAIRDLAGSLIWFMIGLVVAILAHGLAYASHLNLARYPTKKNWKHYRRCAVGLTLSSIILFWFGGYFAYSAFVATAKRPPPTPTLEIR